MLRADYRVDASRDSARLADRLPTHPHPNDSQRNRRCGEITLISRSMKRRGMRSSFSPPHHGHLSAVSLVGGSMRSARLVWAVTIVSSGPTLWKVGAMWREYAFQE